jgi:hypothetical protein
LRHLLEWRTAGRVHRSRHGLEPSGLKRVALPCGVRSGHAAPSPRLHAKVAHGALLSATRGAGCRLSIEPPPTRSSPSPGSDRDCSALSGAAARAAVSPLFADTDATSRTPVRARRRPVATEARN